MTREYKIITKPGNMKSDVYATLGFDVLNSELHHITGEAEDRYDKLLEIDFEAPIFPGGGRGFAYPVDVALEKALAASKHTQESLLTTDACWTSGDFILNKPGDHTNGIEKAIEWWMGIRGSRIGNMGGAALLRASTGEVELILTQLDFGTVNLLTDRSDLQRILHLQDSHKFSGGINIFTALQSRIVLADAVRWSRFTYGVFNVHTIPSIPTSSKVTNNAPLFIENGILSFDSANTLPIYSLLYGVEP